MTLKYGPNLGQLIAAAAGDEHYQAILAQWRALDGLVQAVISSRVSSLPTASLLEGDRYLVTTGANANRIARYREANSESGLNGAWEYFMPREGWSVWSVADAAVYRFKGGAWVREAAVSAYGPVNPKTSSTSLALADLGTYVRLTGSSASTITLPAQSSVAWPDHAEVSIRAAGAGNVTIAAATGVTVNKVASASLVLTQGMTVTLKRVAVDSWDLIGQTVPA